MRRSRLLIPTLKELPADAQLNSHRLMLRAGMIRRVASGIYHWLPLGLRVLRKVEAIVRAEMDATGALELSMPMVQPAEMWQQSGRWQKYGPELLRIQDRHDNAFCLGPTHEELISDLVRREVRSYKQLPLTLYQIQSKFRDEIRPRFGVMRAREFLMKDAYSFHMDQASLEETYQTMHTAYCRIFDRLGLNYRPVEADTGAIGGTTSHEFQVLADAGEDTILVSDGSDYAANEEQACSLAEPVTALPVSTVQRIPTPAVSSIDQVCAALSVQPGQCIKTLLVAGSETDTAIALLLRGDHELNPIKAAHHPAVAEPLRLLDEDEIRSFMGAGSGSIGPLGADRVTLLADPAALQLDCFVCGANEDGVHLHGVCWERDLPRPESLDCRQAQAGEPSPDGQGRLQAVKGIEVGHIFQLGTSYSSTMKTQCLNDTGQATALTMGCYGIGVSRIVAAAIEQHHDDRGICWPAAMAPFDVIIVPLRMHRSQRLQAAAEALYTRLQSCGLAVLLDDRKERPGAMFADADLIGIPHRVVMTDRGLDAGTLEYKARSDSEARDLSQEALLGLLQA